MRYEFPNIFKIWDVRSDDPALVLRAELPHEPGKRLNLDIGFGNVDFVCLPFRLDGIRFWIANTAEVAELSVPEEYRPGRYRNGPQLYVIESQNKRYFIVAYSHYVERNNYNFGTSSLNLNAPKIGDPDGNPWQLEDIEPNA